MNKKSLFINIGNSNITYTFGEVNLKIKKIQKEKIFELENFILENQEKISNIFMCSVNLMIENKIDKFLDSLKISIIKINYKNQNILNLDLMRDPKELGNDVIAQSYWVLKDKPSAIVVSLGTSTIIYVIENYQFKGAIIMPGILESYKTVNNNSDVDMNDFLITDRFLKNMKNYEDKFLGLNSMEALQIGLCKTINVYVEQMQIQNNWQDFPVIVTGGNLVNFRPNPNWEIIEDLEIKGLFKFCKQHKQSTQKTKVKTN